MQKVESKLDFSSNIDEYKKGNLSIKEFAITLDIEYRETMKLLSMMGVDIIDYNFEDDMKFINSYLEKTSK